MPKIDQLGNGLLVATEPMRHMESVAIGVWIRAGGRYEDKGNSGISHLLEHLLFKGTVNRDMMKIKQEIEGRGGSFNGFTSEDHTCYLVKLLAKDAELGIDILSDMVLHPKLDQAELDKEKSVIIEEISMYKDMPSQHVHELLAELMWPGQPLGMPLAGTVDSVRAITRDEIAAYRDAFYGPNNAVVANVGNIEPEDALRLSRKYLSSSAPVKKPVFRMVEFNQKSPELNILSKDTEQTHIAIGLHSPDRFHPDRYALSMMNIILGGNMSSRLFHIVRDEMALCYEIASSVRRYEDCGSFVVSAGVDAKKLSSALDVIMGELDRMRSEPVSDEELARAKEYYRGQLLFALEDTASRMLWLGDRIICGEKEFDAKTILSKVESVTASDIIRVAGAVFKNNNLNMAIVGPIKDRSPVIEALRFK